MNDPAAREELVPETESLLRLVERLSDRMSRGESIDLEAELAARPDDAERLREVFAGLEFMQFMQEPTAAHLETRDQLPEAEPAAGVLGDFRILREIGRGGMGVVYEAEQISLRRRVALKVFPYAGICAPRQLARFQHEARAAASLHHPHIVPVFAVGCERGMHFYAMQFIEGRSLAHLLVELKQSGTASRSDSLDPSASTSPEIAAVATVHEPFTLNARQVAEWGAQAADALDYAHSIGIVHRDIKPANLLLDDRQRLWVTDFGLAQIAAADGLTMTGDILGTLRYMSPEQAAGERGIVDQRTDVYSLGATLYELLSGQPVFGSSERADLLRRILHDEAPPLRRLTPQVPIELATIVHKCLEREPGSRYATASRLAEDLRRFLNDQPIKARSPTWADRARKWIRRNRGLFRLASAFLIVAVGSLIAAAVLFDRERQRTRFEQQARQAEERIARRAQQALAVNHYVTQINRAEQACRMGDRDLARQRLASCAQALRGFEWQFLSAALTSNDPPVAKHEGMAYCVRLAPDHSVLVTTGQDGVRIWDARTFRPIAHLTAHQGDVNGAAFSSDGSLLATSGDDAAVRIWNTRTWEEVAVLQHESHVVAAMFLPGSERLVTAERHRRNAAQERLGQDQVRLWSTATWEDLGALYRHKDIIQSLDVNSDGSLVATGSSDDQACIWDVAKHQVRHRISHVSSTVNREFGVNCVAFAHHAELLATAGGDGVIRLWDVEDRSLQGTLFGRGEKLQFVAFSASDRLIVAGGAKPSVSVWHGGSPVGMRTGSDLVFRGSESMWASTFIDDRFFVTAGRDGAIALHDTRQWPGCIRVPLQPSESRRMAFGPEGRTLIVSGQGLSLFDCATGTLQRTLAPAGELLIGLEVSNDQSRLVAATKSGKIMEWATDDWSLVRESSSGLAGIDDIQFDPRTRRWLLETADRVTLGIYKDDRSDVDTQSHPAIGGRTFVSMESQRGATLLAREAVQFWDGDRLIKELPDEDFYIGAVSRDGNLFAIGRKDGSFVILNLDDPSQTVEFSAPHAIEVEFTADGRTLVIITSGVSAQLWNVATGRKLLDLPTGFIHLKQVELSPDGSQLALLGMCFGGEWDVWLWNVSEFEQAGFFENLEEKSGKLGTAGKVMRN